MVDTTQDNHVSLFLFCDHFMSDNRGKGSFIGVFERIILETSPVTVARFFVPVNISNAKGNELALHISNEKGFNLKLGTVSIPDDHKLVRTVWEVQNLSFVNEGTYTFTLMIDGEPIDTRPLLVERAEDTKQ